MTKGRHAQLWGKTEARHHPPHRRVAASHKRVSPKVQVQQRGIGSLNEDAPASRVRILHIAHSVSNQRRNARRQHVCVCSQLRLNVIH